MKPQVYVRAYLGPHMTFARAMEAQRAARQLLTEAGVSPQVLRGLDLVVSSQRGYRRRLAWSEASVRGYPLAEDDRLGCACPETTACAEDDEATAPAAAEAEEATPSPGKADAVAAATSEAEPVTANAAPAVEDVVRSGLLGPGFIARSSRRLGRSCRGAAFLA